MASGLKNYGENKENRNVFKKRDETEKKVKIYGVKIKNNFNGIDEDDEL